MKLNKSTNKIPDSLKEKMRNIFLNYEKYLENNIY